MPRPIGEDLLALVPSGAELVLDVDVAQLRGWDETERILALLPPAGRARLARLGPHWLGEIDGLAAGAWRGPEGTTSVVVLRGDLDDEHLPALLDGAPVRHELDGHVLYEGDGGAVLRIGPRLVAVGPPVEVRRVAEVVRGDAQGMREAGADRALRAALQRAPGGRGGRPAILGAAIAGPLLQGRVEAAGLGGRVPEAAAFALAVGDGLDAVLVLAFHAPEEALALRREADRQLRDLRGRPFVRMIGLAGALDVVIAARDRETRFAYRLSAERLGGYLDRLDRARRAFEEQQAEPREVPSTAR